MIDYNRYHNQNGRRNDYFTGSCYDISPKTEICSNKYTISKTLAKKLISDKYVSFHHLWKNITKYYTIQYIIENIIDFTTMDYAIKL